MLTHKIFNYGKLTVLRFIALIAAVGGFGAFAYFGGSSTSTVTANHIAPGLPGEHCEELPELTALKAALIAARNFDDGSGGDPDNGGFNLHMWGTIVNRDGIVFGVAFTGANRGDEWPGSRIISAQKANTGNAFSLPGLALSTANLFSAVQPGGSLYGLQESNPVDTASAYAGLSRDYGAAADPLTGEKIGGVNVFGGGLALYDDTGNLLGAIGVSGDSSCADHNIAWRTQNILELDYVPGGVSGDADRPDNIIFDITKPANQHRHPESASGFGHAHCLDADTENAIAAALPVVRAVVP